MKQRFRKPNVRQYWLVTKNRTSRPIVSPNFFAKLMMPFAILMLLRFALVIFVGDSWTRNIAPGTRGRSIASVALRFRFAPPTAHTGDGGVNALTIPADHSVGAGQWAELDRGGGVARQIDAAIG